MTQKNCGAAIAGNPADFVWPLLALCEAGLSHYGFTGTCDVNATILLAFFADFSCVFLVAIFVYLLALGWPSWATHIYDARFVPIQRLCQTVSTPLNSRRLDGSRVVVPAGQIHQECWNFHLTFVYSTAGPANRE